MSTGFSFNNDAVLVGVKHLMELMPAGVDFYSYYINPDKEYYFAEFNEKNSLVTKIRDANKVEKIKSFRKKTQNFSSWLLKETLPLIDYANEISGRRQFELFDEEKHLVLCLRIHSLYDDQNDVLCIVFKPELNVFGIETGNLELTTDSKKIIANIIYKSLIAVLKTANNDKQELEHFNSKTRQIIKKGKQYKDSLNQSIEEYHKSIINIAETYLMELSSDFSIDFILTEDAKNSLRSFNSKPLRLKEIITSAAKFSYNLRNNNEEFVMIEEDYLDIRESDISSNNESDDLSRNTAETAGLSKTEKIEKTLDGYENAIKKVLAKHEKPTGTKVGAACIPAKSGAAITDYLKKNQSDINTLIYEHKSRWILLKENFKPLQNIIIQKAVPKRKVS